MAFQVGDIVVLKAGGPKMTVSQVPSEHANYYRCKWFAGKKLESGTFQEPELKFPDADAPDPAKQG